MRLSPGDLAPDFELPDADEKPVTLMQMRGQRVVLYFYPAALTPGCTTQACDFRDNLSVLRSADTAVIGISPDKPAKLAEFRDKHGLPFPLLSDPEHMVLKAYGAWGEKSLYGKTVTGVIRSTVVVDEHGNVEQAFYSVKATGHVAKLLRDLKLSS
jgi:thioredoxin-dependent peroxiredoxin